ncbi:MULTISPECIES: DUF2252 domain-containing protein [Streptomyces]|uniref:DUF2252 domain-containing protein n=1 Tax=Streptomyces venezuelae (strain ATCC 10712 / CBS 650.69 / DSM 40230 / JCM 4526 / NBRC 13096 / PD 04745) TaxID=953739 RepID=F2R708_STRVP|nr:DUF2252 domain-containing protein [Streptomyces venezuelae]APE19883.1 hypothetical protein vnz_01955 [Streptomyces venezuelae]QER97292.1 DUF2252 domain-containing protein [Streptomyces venezuelae ATCC 10712]CCA53700.1 hypothetical protein SVEN_0413 [Streptomyces venezuelae ATCC 10712]
MTTPSERAARGKAARKRVSRSSHGRWIPSSQRPDPVDVLERQAVDRLPDLVPLRYGRMAVSPFAFLRGAAAVMAADLAAQRHTGLTVQLCGDAHLLNFGVYASPERALLFDVNDFDETHPGPFEWDVKRLAASVAVAALQNGSTKAKAHRAALVAVESYRSTVRRLAGLGELAVWYERISADDLIALVHRDDRARLLNRLSRARRRTSLQALGKLTETDASGARHIVDDPPLLERTTDLDRVTFGKIFSDYRSSLAEERRVLLDRYRYLDAARKVVGVGSVGTRCFVLLLEGRDDGDPLILQIKEAGPSVLEPYLAPSAYSHQGRRVVCGQRLTQAASDIFLGWMTGPEQRHFYWRQLRDMKGSAEVETMTPTLLRDYARLCGRALARAHARSGDRIAIAGYLGGSDVFDRAVADFALAYARQNADDYAALGAAIAAGTVAAAPGA